VVAVPKYNEDGLMIASAELIAYRRAEELLREAVAEFRQLTRRRRCVE
jgi:hypothetical protein